MPHGKTSRAELEQTVSDKLQTYLGSGRINAAKVSEALSPPEMPIQNYESLKQLHFVLSDAVAEFVDVLPDRIRQLRTTTTKHTERTRGEVTGQIDWKRTIEARYTQGHNDRSLFAIRQTEIDYSTPENRLLKKLLSVLASGVKQLQEVDQSWWDGWDRTDPEWLITTLRENVYLDKLPAPEEINLTDRELETARHSRHELYTEAYDLYRLYKDFLADRFESESVENLFQETLVTPSTDATLFELYCLFQYLAYSDTTGELTLKRIRPGDEPFAVLEADSRHIEVYYDQTGPSSFFEKYPVPADLPDETPKAVQRQVQSHQAYRKSLGEFLERDSTEGYYGGRPDMLLLESGSDGTLSAVTIGEVKYTRSPKTFAEGLRQLQEYLHLIQVDDDYLRSIDRDENRVDIDGVLFTDGVSTNVDEYGDITHLSPNGVGE